MEVTEGILKNWLQKGLSVMPRTAQHSQIALQKREHRTTSTTVTERNALEESQTHRDNKNSTNPENSCDKYPPN